MPSQSILQHENGPSIRTRHLVILAAFTVIIAIVGLVCPLPQGSRAFNRCADVMHLPGFLVLAAFAIKLSDRFCGESLRNHALATASVILFGGVMEIVQGQIGRTASVSDFLTNSAGAVSAFLIVISHRVGFAFRMLARSVATLAMIAVTIQPLRSLMDVRTQYLTPATLASFRTDVELERWYIHAAKITLTSTDLNNGGTPERTLIAEFYPDQFPAIQLQHLNQKWSEYSAITFDLARPTDDHDGALEVQLNITASAPPPAKHTSYREVFELLPGDHRKIVMPITKIHKGAHPQRLDLDRIRYVEFMAVDLKQKAIFQLANLRLVKRSDAVD